MPRQSSKPGATGHSLLAIDADACVAYHAASGSGVARLFATFKANASVQAAAATNLIRTVLQVTQSVASEGAPAGAAMPAERQPRPRRHRQLVIS